MENFEYNQQKCDCACHQQHQACCCHDHHCHHDHHLSDEMKAHYFLNLADHAWQEVLKDKIKASILKNQGDHMDKLAKIIAEANSHRWKNKIEKKQGCHDFMEELCKFFDHSKR